MPGTPDETMEMSKAMRELFMTEEEKFLEQREVLTAQTREAFDRTNAEQERAFLDQYATRRVTIGLDKEKAVFLQPVEEMADRKVELAQVTEPSMNYKARRHKRWEHFKAGRKAAQISPQATKDTGYILQCEQEEKQRVAEGKEPQYDTAEKQTALLNEVFMMKMNADIFRKDYFGAHYESVCADMKKFETALRIFNPANPIYSTLSEAQKVRLGALRVTYGLMQNCYDRALGVHNLRVGANGLEVDPTNPAAYAVPLHDAIDQLKKNVEQSENNVVDGLKVKARQEQQVNVTIEQMNPEVPKDQLKKQYPGVPGEYRMPITYSSIDRFLKGLDAPENVLRVSKNKEFIDKILSDYMNCSRIYEDCMMEKTAWDNVLAEIKQKYGDDPSKYDADTATYLQVVEKERQKAVNKFTLYDKQIFDQVVALNHLIFGHTTYTDTSLLLLSKMGYEPAAEMVHSDAEEATFYAEDLEKKNRLLVEAVVRKYGTDPEVIERYSKGTVGRCVMLMRENDEAYNDRILKMSVAAAEAKALRENHGDPQLLAQKNAEALPILEEVVRQQFDPIVKMNVRNPFEWSMDELAANHRKLHDLCIAGMMVSDLAKDIYVEEGVTLRARYLGRPPRTLDATDHEAYEQEMKRYKAREAAFNAQLVTVFNLRRMARAATLLRVNASEVQNPTDVFANVEKGKMDVTTFDGKTPEQFIVDHAKREMELARGKMKQAEDSLINSADAHLWISEDGHRHHYNSPYAAVSTTIHHAEANRIVDDTLAEIAALKDELKTQGYTGDTTNKVMVEKLYAKAKAAGDTEKMQRYEAYYKLTLHDYKLAGSKQTLFPEAIFRAYSNSESEAPIAQMGDEEYHQMLLDLSAGAFYDETTPEADVTAAKEKNYRGLRTYVDKVKLHYEYLEDKYGYEVPNIPWLVSHFEEFTRDFQNIQVDSNVVKHSEGFMDKTNAEDLRVINLIQYYNVLGFAVLNGLVVPMATKGRAGEKMDTESLLTDSMFVEFMSEGEEFKRYLKANPRVRTGNDGEGGDQ